MPFQSKEFLDLLRRWEVDLHVPPPEDLERWAGQLEQALVLASASDWMDLGIACFEMELYPVALRLFTGAGRRLNRDLNPSDTDAALLLLAQTLLCMERPLDAIEALQPLLKEESASESQRLECAYLLGRAYEASALPEGTTWATHFYRQVVALERSYRDARERLKALTPSAPAAAAPASAGLSPSKSSKTSRASEPSGSGGGVS